MSDASMRIGQYFPDASSHGSRGRTGASASRPSFEDLLKRQQLSPAQLEALLSPSVPSNTEARHPTFNANPTQSALPISSFHEIDSPRLIEKPLPPDLANQTQELLNHAPEAIPHGDALAETMLRNYQEYQRQANSVDGGRWTEDSSERSVTSDRQPVSGGHAGSVNAFTPGELTSPSVEKTNSSGGIFNQAPSPSVENIQAQSLDHDVEPQSGAQATPQRQVIWSANMSEEQTSKTVQSLFHENGSIREEGWAALSVESENTDSEQPTDAQESERTEIPERQGISDAFGSFFKNLLSGMTLGFYQPESDSAPTGVMRVIDPFKKLVYDAPIKSLVIGVPIGAYHSAGTLLEGQDSRSNDTQEVNRMTTGRRSSKPWLQRNARS